MIQISRDRKALLMLYRHAVDEEAENPAEIDVMGLLMGGMKDIRCEVCGEVKVWTPNLRKRGDLTSEIASLSSQ
jgi:hypothetical protein